MTAHFSLISGQVEQRRPHTYTWRPATNHVLNPHCFGPAWQTPLAISNYGKTWSVSGAATSIAELQALPVNRRCLRWQSQAWLMTNADDRCDAGYGSVAAAVAAGAISAQPYSEGFHTPGLTGRWFTNDVGIDAVVSGYSNFFFDANIIQARAWATALAAAYVAAGVTVDRVAMDSEVNSTVGSAWQTALQADSRWTTMKARLDALALEWSAGATATFDVSTWPASPWHAYYHERQALIQTALIEGLRTQFPHCVVSDDGFYGRSAAIVTARTYDAGDLNGNQYFQTNASIVDYTAEEQYSELNNVEGTTFDSRTRGQRVGHLNPYIAAEWEIARAMGSIDSGNALGSWVNYIGASRSDTQMGGANGAAAAADPCPYHVALYATLALMSSVPVIRGAGYGDCGVLGYFSDTLTSERMTLANGGVDQANHLIWDNGDKTQTVRAGISTSFEITGSTGNDGIYTINYSNGGIWYDSGADRTYMRVNESIPSATSDGFIDFEATDGTDAVMEAVLVDLDAHIGTTGPRKVLSRPIYIGESNTATDTEGTPSGSFITWTTLRHGPNVTYCIVIGRTSATKSAWASQAITGYVNGVSIGTVATVSASKAYVYCTRAYSASDVVTFKWTQTTPTNLLGTETLTDTGTWTKTGGTVTLDATHLSPITGASTFLLFQSKLSATVTVTPGMIYTFAVYAWDNATSRQNNIAVYRGSDGTTSLGGINSQLVGHGYWQLQFVNVCVPHDETTLVFAIGQTNYNSWYVHPRVVQGILPGPTA